MWKIHEQILTVSTPESKSNRQHFACKADGFLYSWKPCLHLHLVRLLDWIAVKTNKKHAACAVIGIWPDQPEHRHRSVWYRDLAGGNAMQLVKCEHISLALGGKYTVLWPLIIPKKSHIPWCVLSDYSSSNPDCCKQALLLFCCCWNWQTGRWHVHQWRKY